VPLRYRGGTRRVYPGFMQISGFMSMNLERHTNAFLDLYHHVVNRETDKANATRLFYEEYFAMMDLSALRKFEAEGIAIHAFTDVRPRHLPGLVFIPLSKIIFIFASSFLRLNSSSYELSAFDITKNR